jgi:hypothetical protein
MGPSYFPPGRNKAGYNPRMEPIYSVSAWHIGGAGGGPGGASGIGFSRGRACGWALGPLMPRPHHRWS